ncbi:MAG: hypothetical protein ISEC1_P1637 [Thiomicrorhabdus sp.]|nr:MAG: hypothetical protein ISEC1_P1637 [Thiomicrorhabdus sp.]
MNLSPIKQSVTKQRVLYLPSTPLNVFVSVAHAAAFSKQQVSQLVLIDQQNIDDNVYFNALKIWPTSPFEKLDLLAGKAKGRDKLAERKQNFQKLVQIIEQFQPDVIAVGSDRRVEFQYLMHYCKQQKISVEAWYLDDGLYSYAGRPNEGLKDWVNSTLKKMAYGFWWEEPKTVGASSLIGKVWLFQPEHAVDALKTKESFLIQPDWFTSKPILEFSKLLLTAFSVSNSVLEALQNTSLLLLLPHPDEFKKMPGYEANVCAFVKRVTESGQTLAVKYHPRVEGADPLGLAAEYNARIIPSGLAFEFLLPFFKEKMDLVGDVSTVLLTAKWLRPDIRGVAVLSDDDAFQNSFKVLFETLGVNIENTFDAVATNVGT